MNRKNIFILLYPIIFNISFPPSGAVIPQASPCSKFFEQNFRVHLPSSPHVPHVPTTCKFSTFYLSDIKVCVCVCVCLFLPQAYQMLLLMESKTSSFESEFPQ